MENGGPAAAWTMQAARAKTRGGEKAEMKTDSTRKRGWSALRGFPSDVPTAQAASLGSPCRHARPVTPVSLARAGIVESSFLSVSRNRHDAWRRPQSDLMHLFAEMPPLPVGRLHTDAMSRYLLPCVRHFSLPSISSRPALRPPSALAQGI